ncbi:MAG: hypothetical protein LLG04_16415 [Parachlamydia sp.]|nr:hypothetical protein [Parachlamydia sp.]
MQEKFQEITAKIKETKTEKAMLQSEKSRIIIQMQCLKLLNSRTDVKEFKKILEEFPARLGDYPPFKAEISKLFQKIYRVPTPKDGWMVKDTDDWQDLHLCGTEVQGSCLNVSNHEVVNNKCVLGVMLDGKTRMIAVSDEKGVLKARCFARPLWVEEKGKFVYDIERIYIGDKDPDLPALVKKMCLRRAEALGLEPVVSGFCVKMDKWKVDGPYSGGAESKGSRCEWEYVDSAGGASAGPVYTIDDLYRVSKDQ